MIPAFHDAHAHVWKIGHLLTTMLDLRGVDSVAAVVARVAAFRPRLPEGAWLLGRGFNEANMAEGRMPTRVDLDRAAPDQPVVLTRTCGHIYAANSAALARAGITATTAAPVAPRKTCPTTASPSVSDTQLGSISAKKSVQMMVAAKL